MPVLLERCPFCGGHDIRQVWGEVGFDRCSACGLYFRNPMPTYTELESLYGEAWKEPVLARSETGGTEVTLARAYVRELVHSIGRQSLAGLRILDFGAGRGAMLDALCGAGAEVCGVDPFGHEYLRARGYECHPDLGGVNGKVDGIVMFDVLEHLQAPWETLSELRDCLVQGGWICVAVPNPTGLNAKLMREQWREARRPGHLMFPSPRTVEQMLERAGFVRARRLRWHIRYHGFPRCILDSILQSVGLDGGLRYLAWR